eukprot:GHRR01015792.1.p1 GENE.GHRR01015792.1~~GHRR01015792.1.p1  ORF type:complete len:257 (+),score=54.71 GHRR01015792.1:92-862(+)
MEPGPITTGCQGTITGYSVSLIRVPAKTDRRKTPRHKAVVSSSAAAGASPLQIQDWHDVTQPLLWLGTEKDALEPASPLFHLSAPWRMLLLSDGSVTRHLQLLTGHSVSVECLQMELVSTSELRRTPPKAMEIPGPLVQRQVLLWPGTANGPAAPVVYATSWWASATVDQYLADKDLPIWVSLAKGQMELYREIQLVQLGHNKQLEQYFQCPGPFWGRQYYFWHKGTPLTLIHEVFSNKLQHYLGPQSTNEHPQNG